MLMTVNQIRSTIRKIIIRENASYEDKLANLIGRLDLGSIRQALELGVSLDLVEEYEEFSRGLYSGDLYSFSALVKRSFAKKIEAAIKSNPNPSLSQPFMDSRNYELLHYEEDELPENTRVTIRVQVP